MYEAVSATPRVVPGLSGVVAAIVAAALSMLNPKDPSVGGGGGLADVVSAFNKGGLGDVMASWVAGGPNKPVDPGALANVLGPDVLGQFARKAVIGSADASSAPDSASSAGADSALCSASQVSRAA